MAHFLIVGFFYTCVKITLYKQEGYSVLKITLYLLKYLLIFLCLFLPPLGVFTLCTCIAALFGSKSAFNRMYAIDVLIASFVFSTRFRTISGITGQRMEEGKRFWKTKARFIDWLAVMFGDKPDHCLRAWHWERDNLTRLD